MTIKSKILLPLLILVSTFVFSPINAAEVPKSMKYQGTTLMLNGQGTRVKFFMKIYESSLYLESANNNAKEILSTNAPMSIRIDVLSSLVTPEAMKTALNEGLEKSTGKNTTPIKKEIDQLNATFNSDVGSGDFYEFIYLPDSGVHVLKNSYYIDVIPGIEFKKAFFGIYLSSKPIQKSLKKAMLGG